MRKILIELQVDWEGYEDVSDELIVEDAIQEKVEGVGWTLLRQLHVIKSLPEYNEILYHAKTLSDEQFREYWNEVQGNVF